MPSRLGNMHADIKNAASRSVHLKDTRRHNTYGGMQQLIWTSGAFTWLKLSPNSMFFKISLYKNIHAPPKESLWATGQNSPVNEEISSQPLTKFLNVWAWGFLCVTLRSWYFRVKPPCYHTDVLMRESKTARKWVLEKTQWDSNKCRVVWHLCY